MSEFRRDRAQPNHEAFNAIMEAVEHAPNAEEQIIALEEIIDELWFRLPEEEEATAVSNLQEYLKHRLAMWPVMAKESQEEDEP